MLKVWNRKMKPCCPIMADELNAAGSYGSSVEPADVSSKDIHHRVTRIVFRAVDKDQEDLLRIESPVPVSTKFEVGISFCPWCGKRLH